jgi:hypothetical protein
MGTFSLNYLILSSRYITMLTAVGRLTVALLLWLNYEFFRIGHVVYLQALGVFGILLFGLQSVLLLLTDSS